MSPTGTSHPGAPRTSSLGRTLVRVLVSLLVLALVGVSVVLLALLNARTYRLETRGDRLEVMKGRLLPLGLEPFRPGDAALAEAYAPLELEGATPSAGLGARLWDRDEVDRALFRVIAELARPNVASNEPKRLERGLYYLRRAELLQGLSAEQRTELSAMRAEVAFFHARLRLDEASRVLAQGIAELKLAAAKGSHVRPANQMLLEVEPAAKALDEALRRAVHSLSAPAIPPGPNEEAGALSPDAGTPPPTADSASSLR